MNAAAFATLLTDVCVKGAEGTDGPDRITQNTYDAAHQLIKVETGIGVDARSVVTATFTSNGKVKTVTDANENRTTYDYDGHDRLSKTSYPSKGFKNISSTADFEIIGYDAASHIKTRQLRDGQTITYGYDHLGRLKTKTLPLPEDAVTYEYDWLNQLTAVTQGGQTLEFTYDHLGRNLTQEGPQGTVTSEYDLAGRRTKVTYPGTGLYVNYDYLFTGEVWKIRENGATTGAGVLASYRYDDLGRLASINRGNGVTTTYTYGPISRLTSIAHAFDPPNVTGDDDTLTFTHNPANQIKSRTRTNDGYTFAEHEPVSRPYTSNGLNQYTLSGTITPTYDARGNLRSAGPVDDRDPVTPNPTMTYEYTSENLLIKADPNLQASDEVLLAYDPLMRLYEVTEGTTVKDRIAYDGVNRIADYDGSDVLTDRYVFGPGMDQPIVWYEGGVLANRRWLIPDERGSIMTITNGTGATVDINSYDEYGIPGSNNSPNPFQYTGQAWIEELQMYYYKARIYSPTLGRFLQTDPIGYGDDINLYAYVGNDPVNSTDPLGLQGCDFPSTGCVVTGGVGIDIIYVGAIFFGSGGGYFTPEVDVEPMVKTNENTRPCSSFQKAAEKVADISGDASSAATDAALISGAASVLTGGPLTPPGLFAARASQHFATQAAFYGTVNLVATVLSGASWKAAVDKAFEKATDRVLRRVNEDARNALTDRAGLTDNYARCR